MPASQIPQLKLLKNRQRRLLSGHEWIFSNEIDPQSLTGINLIAGQFVHFQDHRGKFLASAYYNPATLIAARVIDRQPVAGMSRDLLRNRLHFAKQSREQIYGIPHYRWVHGESDRLPGLVIDRFGSCVSVQITTAGMERLRNDIVAVLQEDESITGIIVHDDLEFRKLEGLPTGEPQTFGDIPEILTVREAELQFNVPALTGQKTGWFYDQRDNRIRLARYANGKSVADLYCYAGAWGIHAARAGASEVTCVDSSANALETVIRNAALNKLELKTVQADAVATLKSWAGSNTTFDIVVIDPPALIKRRKDEEAGRQAYYQLNRLAAKAVRPGGILVSCSCSHHLPEEELVSIVNHAAWNDDGRSAAILEFGTQSADHPVHPAMPETRYLKAIFARLG